MKRVEPAPTIRPMMYAIRILFIWFGSFFVYDFILRLFCSAWIAASIFFISDIVKNSSLHIGHCVLVMFGTVKGPPLSLQTVSILISPVTSTVFDLRQVGHSSAGGSIPFSKANSSPARIIRSDISPTSSIHQSSLVTQMVYVSSP